MMQFQALYGTLISEEGHEPMLKYENCLYLINKQQAQLLKSSDFNWNKREVQFYFMTKMTCHIMFSENSKIMNLLSL